MTRRPDRRSRATGLLREFNDAGVLAPADVHVAARLAALAGERDETVLLAAALAVRAPRLGHVYVDLATIRDTATVDTDEPVDLTALPWPEPDGLGSRGSRPAPLVGGPLQLEGSGLYLDRYWREERQARRRPARADARAARSTTRRRGRPRALRRRPQPAARRGDRACAGGSRSIAGGPGTGKTTTVARIVALLLEQDRGDR